MDINDIQKFVDKAKIDANINPRGPVDVEKMAKQLRFAVLRTPALPHEVVAVMSINIQGQFKEDLGSQKLIALNKDFDEYHQRFAIAHELGHFYMHKNLLDNDGEHAVFAMTEDSEEGEEGEACKFAALLLMEKRSFGEEFKRLKEERDNEKVDIIYKLSQKFKAPQRSVMRRIEELSLSYD